MYFRSLFLVAYSETWDSMGSTIQKQNELNAMYVIFQLSYIEIWIYRSNCIKT